MRTYPYAILALAVVWMFLAGSLTLLTFLVGLLFAALAVVLTRRILKPELRESFPRVLRRLPAFLLYAGFFVKNVIIGNLDVAYRAVHPDLPVYPGILAVDIEGLSDLEVTMIANTITLTPGTLTLDFDMNRDRMFIHTINARELEEVREEIQTVQRYVRRVLK
ncbi:MAG: Na+/H+ antiporter subunit E [Thermoplasmata archaeon]